MNRQTIDLGYILRQFPKYDFKMNEFDDRLRLQKFVYLLQIHDIYLGYDFSWYLRGPYCTTLARRGFALERIYGHMPRDKVWFERKQVQNRFEKFKEFITDRIQDVEFLEAAASLHMLKLGGVSDEQACLEVNRKNPKLDIPYCKKVLKDDVAPLLESVQLTSLPAFNAVQITLDKFEESSVVDDPDMDYKHTDKTIYYMLKDAAGAGLHLVGKNVFRPDDRHPRPDPLVVDKATTIQLLARR